MTGTIPAEIAPWLPSADRHRQKRVQAWRALEHQFGFLIVQGAGVSAAFIVALVFCPMPNSAVVACGLGLWLSGYLLVRCTSQIEECRQWQDYHTALEANPSIWPWPKMPGEA